MTDWNKEAELRVQYINWLVDSENLPCLVRKGAKDRLDLFYKLGVMYVQDFQTGHPDESVLSYERWREHSTFII